MTSCDAVADTISSVHGSLVHWPVRAKLFVAMLADAALMSCCMWCAYFLRLSIRYERIDAFWTEPLDRSWQVMAIAAAVIAPITLYAFGFYREVTRFVGSVITFRIVKGMAVTTAVLLGVALFVQSQPSIASMLGASMRLGTLQLPWPVLPIFGALGALALQASRVAARGLLAGARAGSRGSNVAIYGVGAAGLGLHAAIVHGRQERVVAFFDDNPKMAGRSVDGIPVFAGDRCEEVIASREIRTVMLALPRAVRSRRRIIIERLTALGTTVLTVPTIAELADGSVRMDQLRPVTVEDLLGRAPVQIQLDAFERLVVSKCVLVSGAGGSIGSELCRRAIRAGCARLVLVEQSERHLYEIETEVRDALALDRRTLDVVAILGSVTDSVLMERVMRQHGVETVYHAAAAKHVPILENHESVGVETNVFGTLVMAEAAASAGVQAFILISTDKAVRPSSVMGASKRAAEMVLQAMHAQRSSGTRFAMVRFGNVLGSSGSVVPRFRAQIEHGGPVTVTHADMVRYFMTITEAVELVMQAGGLADGGEVFMLDMGEPVRIMDLARNMIRLAGFSVRDQAHSGGDIEIVQTGIRPGEKLVEELRLSDQALPTRHPSIAIVQEPYAAWDRLEPQLQRLRAAVDQRDDAQVRGILGVMVGGYNVERARGASERLS